ncbi:MAG: hypothetical protein IJM75_08920 [Ruminococcus sp.]|nr:hypothetical protein [Ruminococcus sp.]
MPKKNENLSPEQIKVQLDKRSEQYFNDRYSLIDVKVRASYDKNGLIMDKQLNAAKKELEAPAAKPAAAKK